MGQFKDLTGQQFGKLTVLHRDKNDYVSPKGYRAANGYVGARVGRLCP